MKGPLILLPFFFHLKKDSANMITRTSPISLVLLLQSVSTHKLELESQVRKAEQSQCLYQNLPPNW